MNEPGLLLISFLFPPAGGVAVQRALSLARYLPGNGYRVHVLAASNGAAPIQDESLLKHVPAHVPVHHAFMPTLSFAWRQKLRGLLLQRGGGSSPQKTGTGGRLGLVTTAFRRLLCPDPEILWNPFALRAASRLIRKHSIETVLVTAPPFSTLLAGIALKRRHPHIQLVSDFRDSWLAFYLSTFDYLQSDWMRRRSAEMEREVISHSDLVVTVTPSIVEELRNRYPDLAGKVHCIPNGYDPELFAGFQPRPHGTGKVVVTYLGTLYQASSARYYLRALEKLPAEIASRFETRFIGRITSDEQPYLDQHKHTLIRQLGFLPQREGLRMLEETDYLLLTMTDPASVTGKIFEYVATGKPTLAFSPPGGEVPRILAESEAGWCVDPADEEGACRMLLHAASLVSPEAAAPRRSEATMRYDRMRLTSEYARLMRAGRDQ